MNANFKEKILATKTKLLSNKSNTELKDTSKIKHWAVKEPLLLRKLIHTCGNPILFCKTYKQDLRPWAKELIHRAQLQVLWATHNEIEDSEVREYIRSNAQAIGNKTNEKNVREIWLTIIEKTGITSQLQPAFLSDKSWEMLNIFAEVIPRYLIKEMLEKIPIFDDIGKLSQLDQDMKRYFLAPSYMLLLLEYHENFNKSFHLLMEKNDWSQMQSTINQEADKCPIPPTV